MKCLNPLTCEANYNEKERKYLYSVKRTKQESCTEGFLIACGQCIACRINRARMWSIRCVHESMFHDESCFITLTYNPENLPDDLSVSNDEHQKFMKRLRHHIKKPIKYYMAAEYGQPTEYERDNDLSNIGRPHYHYLIFGWSPTDCNIIGKKKDNIYYSSPTVLNAWQNKGFVVIGDVTSDSALYVAQYCTKKITGDSQDAHYFRIHPDTHALLNCEPEFQRCSHGIGKKFIDTYPNDLRKGFITHENKKYPIPRYYLKKLNEKWDTGDNQVKKEIGQLLDDIAQSRGDTENFEILPDFQDLNYSYNVAKVYQERNQRLQSLTQNF